MYCPKCGKKAYPEANFCIYCGRGLLKKKASRKRKKLIATVSIIVIILLIFMTISYFLGSRAKVKYIGDIKNLRWGMTKGEVEEIENFRAKDYSDTSHPLLEYGISKKINEDEFIKGYEGKIQYFFDFDDKLRRAELYLTHKKFRPRKKDKYYNEIMEYFKGKYGEAEEIENYIIDDARAFQWYTDRSKIVLVFNEYGNEDYFKCSLIYSDMDLLKELEN